MYLALTVVILILAGALFSLFGHFRRKYFAARRPAWYGTIKMVLNGMMAIDEFKIARQDRRFFRSMLIREYIKESFSGRETIKEIYRRHGFLGDDFAELKSRFWWKRIEAIERLTGLELAEAESCVIDLVNDPKNEVRLAVFKMLTKIGSPSLWDHLTRIFNDNTKWLYRYIINRFYLVDIPNEKLLPLVSSSEKGHRKAAAVLFGKKDNVSSIPILGKLIHDDVADVRREAIRSLGRIGSSEAIPFLKDKVRDSNSQVKAVLAIALAAIKTEEALAILELLADDDNFEVKFQTFFALSSFGEAGDRILRKYELKYPRMVAEFVQRGGLGRA